MAVFIYSAIDPATSKTVEGKVEALNLREAKDILRSQGHIPTRIEQDEQSADLGELLQKVPLLGDLLGPRVGQKDICLMTQQMSTLLNAGIPLIEGLFLLEQQSENKALKEILKKVRADVIAGDSFSAAITRYPKLFSRLYVNMIRSGEVSGELETVCSRLAFLMEKTMALQATIQGALVYPAFTVLVIVAVIVVIMIVVVPQFQAMFANFGAELPLPTRILIDASNFTLNFWWAILVGCGTFFFWFNMFRLGKGKPLVDQWLLTIPLIGTLFRKVYVSRFVRTLASTVGAGIALVEALVTASATVDNYVLRAAFDKAKESILQGGTLARPLEQTNAFPIMVVKMIAIAEETGRMEEMLNKSADYLDVEVDRAVDTLTTMIEPIMIIVLGGLLLGVALALYIPLFDMSNIVAGN
ncbi:type II secretion system F family protein [Vampirovibrio chlorellavorus]|uniref:type II secretion system F family protein n=1 Tax=Vampirovibrio chlorellavorus TaxID=758823 RepID=UPI0026F21EFC|nr:type II secretion system F family protein [Vampirovibrio chlorellavorus]